MSGVSRLRAARKGGGMNPIEHANQKQGRHGSAADCAKPSDFGAPKKASPYGDVEYTGVPKGRTLPVRGENTNAPVRVASK